MKPFTVRAECLVEFDVLANSLEEAESLVQNRDVDFFDAQPKEVVEIYRVLETEEK